MLNEWISVTHGDIKAAHDHLKPLSMTTDMECEKTGYEI